MGRQILRLLSSGHSDSSDGAFCLKNFRKKLLLKMRWLSCLIKLRILSCMIVSCFSIDMQSRRELPSLIYWIICSSCNHLFIVSCLVSNVLWFQCIFRGPRRQMLSNEEFFFKYFLIIFLQAKSLAFIRTFYLLTLHNNIKVVGLVLSTKWCKYYLNFKSYLERNKRAPRAEIHDILHFSASKLL